MKAAGVPTVPGSDGPVESVEQARAFAEAVGYPVLIKASAGGGGTGMREVHDPADLQKEFDLSLIHISLWFQPSNRCLRRSRGRRLRLAKM